MEVKTDLTLLAQRRIDSIHKKLIAYEWGTGEIGLTQGKMGVSLYFFLMSSSIKDESGVIQKDAENLLMDVFGQLDNRSATTGFNHGLAGIAYGIQYLIREGYVEGDANDVLEEVDDIIFREIAHSSQFNIGLRNGILGYLTYLLPRIEKGGLTLKAEKDYMFKQLLIVLLNQLGDAIEEQKLKLKEPILFNITWELPICLMLLASAIKLRVYNTKAEKILTYLSDSVLSLYPRLQSNRLSLLVGMENVLREINMAGWKEHLTMLRAGIDLEHIFYSELNDKNINGANGIAGIYWLMTEYNRVSGSKHPFRFDIYNLMERIIQSTYWEDDITKDNEYSLFYGLPGIGLILSDLIRQEKNNRK